jgi:uncharacterized protein
METKQAIKVIDFWQKNSKKELLFSRDVLEKVDSKSSEVVDLIGIRRSGKSSILKLIISKLKNPAKSLYLNFEDPFFITHNRPETIEEMIEIYKIHFNPDLKFLFFDEIQAIDKWESAIRKLREGGFYKIFITGSSSKLLSSELSTLLTGRHLSLNVFPLSFSEFLDVRGVAWKTQKQRALGQAKIEKEFDSFLKWGGFPEIVKTRNAPLLKTYFYDILQKDIVSRYDIRDKAALEKMAVFVLSNSAKIVSLESLKNSFNLSYETVSNYLSYFKEAFLISELNQFSYSLKTQQKSFKKIYSIDQGLSGAVSFRFSDDRGRMLENAVFVELSRRGEEIYYYKTKKNSEVDFYVHGGRKKILIQVCQSLADEKTKRRETRSLALAMKEMKVSSGLILTENEEGEIVEDDEKIKILPVWEWMLG